MGGLGVHLAALLLSLPNLGLHSTTSAPAALATSARDWYAGHVTTTRSLQSVKSARTCTSAKQENTHQRTEVRADFTDWGGGRRVRSVRVDTAYPSSIIASIASSIPSAGTVTVTSSLETAGCNLTDPATCVLATAPPPPLLL